MRQNFLKALRNLKIFATAEKIYKCRCDQRKKRAKCLLVVGLVVPLVDL